METIVPNQPQIGQAERVYQTHGISPALNVGWTPKVCGTEKDLDNVDTIRQLTPKECWRLQGFPDWAYNRAKEVNNEPQLYHQAGNAVTVNVVKDIANRLHSTY